MAPVGQRAPARVLIVDDDAGIRELISSALSDEGYDVATAADGRQALAVVEEVDPALIVLDLRMPVIDGWQFARLYRQRPGRHAPIVVCTAALDAAKDAAEIGAEGFIGKPFRLEDLLQQVEDHHRPS